MIDQDRSHFLAMVNAGIAVSWDGRRVVAPPGVIDANGIANLEPFVPANFKKPASKKQQ
jgi:hypothetical protein